MSTDTQNDVRYPDVEVNLFEIDGNAFSIMGAVTKALRRGGVDKATRDEYIAEATAGDYDHLLVTTMKWVTT